MADLWTVPAYLRTCALLGSAPDEVRLLQRTDGKAWTVSDLPLLDAARQRLGDPEAGAVVQRQREAAEAAARESMSHIIDHLIETDDSEMAVMSHAPRAGPARRPGRRDRTARQSIPTCSRRPFAHIVVDEAQELTDAEWQMLLRRCPSRSFTIVGDRAQARHGFTESWRGTAERIGFDRIDVASLSINYRTPKEIMAQAEPVIRAAIPDANVPTSIRSSGHPGRTPPDADLGSVLDSWLQDQPDGVACVIGVDASEPTASRCRPAFGFSVPSWRRASSSTWSSSSTRRISDRASKGRSTATWR